MVIFQTILIRQPKSLFQKLKNIKKENFTEFLIHPLKDGYERAKNKTVAIISLYIVGSTHLDSGYSEILNEILYHFKRQCLVSG